MASSAWAQLQTPQLGVMIDRANVARAVFGVAGSVTAGDPMVTGVMSSACSAQLCLFKTRSAIEWAGGQTEAPPGPAIFSINGTSALVYFSKNRELARWENGKLTRLELKVAGDILSVLAMADGTMQFAARRDGAISVVDENDAVLGSIPGMPVLLMAEGAIYADQDALVLRRPDATELRWALSGIAGFSMMGDGYVQIRAASGSYALRVVSGREQLFALPEVTP